MPTLGKNQIEKLPMRKLGLLTASNRAATIVVMDNVYVQFQEKNMHKNEQFPTGFKNLQRFPDKWIS